MFTVVEICKSWLLNSSHEFQKMKISSDPTFSLVDQSGNTIVDESQMGLLLYNGGTVCDDGFSDNSANAICKVLGFDKNIQLTNGNRWPAIQETYEVRLDDINCQNDDWDSCTNSRYHHCDHNEDIFLQCGDSTAIMGNTIIVYRVMGLPVCVHIDRFP